MGVQFFAGKFYKCVYENETRVPYEIVANKTQCLAKNLTWMNSRINFDNVANSYLALLQVATFKGWTEIMADASDISEVNLGDIFLEKKNIKKILKSNLSWTNNQAEIKVNGFYSILFYSLFSAHFLLLTYLSEWF